jgi:hypothetical protein
MMFQIVYELPDGKGWRFSGGYESQDEVDRAISRLTGEGATIVRIERGIFRPADDPMRGLSGGADFGPPS